MGKTGIMEAFEEFFKETKDKDVIVMKLDGFEFNTNSDNFAMTVHKNDGECDCIMCRCYFAVKDLLMAELNNSAMDKALRTDFNNSFDDDCLQRNSKEVKEEIMDSMVISVAVFTSSVLGQFLAFISEDELNKRLQKIQTEKDVVN